ncbi:MAG: hypothetical protein ACYS6I_06085 [Planctomycetota bacterium]|jgi:flagellar motor switch protein FliG
MARIGKRKAAMLLAGLDAATATELLKGQPQEVIQEVAVELSHLDAAGQVDNRRYATRTHLSQLRRLAPVK